MTGDFGALINRYPCARLAACDSLNGQATHLTLPIEAVDQQLGVINLLDYNGHSLSEEDLDLLEAISGQISEIVANAWLRLKLAEKEAARRYLLESLVEAQEEERSRLARELHDGAGQMLTTLLVRIKALERKTAEPQVQEGLGVVLDLVAGTVEQVRDLSYRLRPAALEEFGLTVALETLAGEMLQETGIRATFDLAPGDQPLPHGVEVTLYRIVQEALTNVLRHAQANTVQIAVKQQPTGLTLTVCDDGCGFTPGDPPLNRSDRHLGLISMSERAAMLGGTFFVDSAPGQGTTIQVHVPLTQEAAKEAA